MARQASPDRRGKAGPRKPTVQLQHLFVAGLRFDKELQRVESTPRGTRFKALGLSSWTGRPGSRRADHGDGCLANLALCAVVLGAGQAEQLHAQEAIPSEPDDALQNCLARFAKQLDCTVVTGSTRHLGAMVLAAIETGQMCLVELVSPKAVRWSAVVGVEREMVSCQVRALLLLDACADEPWGCGYNARLMLQGVAGRAVRGNAEWPLALRYLTGEARAVKVGRVVVCGANRVHYCDSGSEPDEPPQKC